MNLEHRLTERFQKALTEFELIADGDKILVGLSGGKDSLCLLELLAKRKRIFKPRFDVEAIHVRMENIEYETDTSYLKEFSEAIDVKLHVVETSFDASTDHRSSPCFLCSWNRRKKMFELAKELKFNKIAFGHHQDDIICTALMNEFYQGRFGTMPVKMQMEKMPITIIRPLCLIREREIAEFAKMRGYKKQVKLCPYEKESHRADISELFAKIEEQNTEAPYSIWNALARDGKLTEGFS